MSSSVAPLAFGIVGAVIGSFFGATALGFAAGAMLGGALFPTTTEGPKLQDLHLQGSSYGAPIPIVYGTVRTAGNVIWKTELTPHEHTSGGKGGSGTPQQKTTSYSASFDICICESKGDHTLGRVWVNGQLKGDYRDGASEVGELPLVFYDGNPAQAPDPTEEGIIGVGRVPAYRGVARVVLTDMDLSPYGNVIPIINFEILSGSVTDCPVHSVLEGELSDTWLPGTGAFPVVEVWDDPSVEPALTSITDDTVIWTRGSLFTSPSWEVILRKGPLHTITLDGVKQTHPTWVQEAVQFNASHDYDGPLLWGTTPILTAAIAACPGNITLDVNQWNVTAVRKVYTSEANDIPNGASGGTCLLVPVKQIALNDRCGIPDNLYLHALVGTPDTKRLFVITGPTLDVDNCDEWWELINGQLSRHGTIDPPLSKANFGFLHAVRPAADGCSMAENNGQYLWGYQLAGGQQGLHCYKIDAAHNLAQICTTKQLSTTPGLAFSPATMWTFSAGRCGVARYHHFEIFQRYDASEVPTTTLAEIAADVCTRTGLTAYDVSDIEDVIVRGYILNSIPTTGRAALESILPAYFVEAVESDGAVKFVRRGKASLITIPDDDLSAHGEGETLPDKLQVIHGQDEDLPAHLILNYINAGVDYLIGTQQWRRQTGGSKVVKTINLSLVLTDSEAKRLVDAWGALTWAERDQYFWTTTRKYIRYEPTDVKTVQGIDLRILNKTEQANGVIKWEGRKSRFGIFAQPGVGGAGGSTPGVITAAQDTDLLLLDIPYITDPQKQQVVPVAMAGADRQTWAGATLFKSINDGASFDSLLSDAGPADSIGVTDGVLGDWSDGCVFDEANSVTVVMSPGAAALSGQSRTAVLNGANQFLVGDEILAAKNCVLVDTRTYVLSGLLRGLHGTEWATGSHVDGERVVVLPTTTVMDAIWSEYGAARQYQAVTAGQALPAGSGSGTGAGSGFDAVHIIDVGAWGHHVVYTNDHGGFGLNDLVAIKFTTGTGPSVTNNKPRIAGAEYGGSAVNRIYALSTTVGDFVGLPYFQAKGESSAVTVPFTVDNTNNDVYYPILLPNTVYYLNVKIAPGSGATGDAPMYFELSPNGCP